MRSLQLRALPVALMVLVIFALSSCSLGVTSNTPVPTSAAPVPTTTPISRAASTTAATTTTSATTAATATVAGSATTGSAASPTTTTAPATTAATASTVLTSAPMNGSGQLLSVAEINRRARGAVVQITNNQTQRAQGGFGTSSYQVPAGVGTGFIFDKRGFILTNNHVVEGAQSLTVSTTDDKTYDGKLVGAYPNGDLAVVQIMGNGDFPTVPLGDSSKLQVGDPLVAIGNALALPGGPTVTSGVVSALGRVEQEPSGSPSGGSGSSNQTQPGAFLTDLIQTDAAINPGNSGGPLFNGYGEVIGINTLGAGEAEPGVQAQGIGFAISINNAKQVANALMNNQTVPRPYVGITSGALSPAQAAQYKLPVNVGVGVANVASGSPAEMAGLQKNDIIVKLDGQTVRGEDGFVGLLNTHKPGDTVTLTVQRNGQQQDIKLTLAQYPAR